MSCEAATRAITTIYSLPEIDECIAKLVKKDLQHDFKQELFLILLQVPCERVEQMNGSFKYFVVRIILNLVRQKRNVFHKTYLDKTVEYNTDRMNYQASSPADVDTITERMEREQREEAIISRISGIDESLGNHNYPYHEAMIALVVKLGSMRKAAIETGIPEKTVQRTVKRIREHLRK